MAEDADASGALDKIARLLALSVVADRPQAEQIRVLGASGFTPSEIAGLVGTTANTVSVTLSKQKRERTARPKKKT